MSETDHITDYLCESIDAITANLDRISNDIHKAGNLLIQTLLNDRKIIICGNGLSCPISTILSTYLINQQEFDRPSLPALNLSTDSACLLAIGKSHNYHQIFSQQISTLGVEGDTLITFSVDGSCSNIIQAIQTAHENNIQVINISGTNSGKISAILQAEDLNIEIDNHSVARVLEIQLLIANSLCHRLEMLLFGDGTH